jgi:hypothetical protein
MKNLFQWLWRALFRPKKVFTLAPGEWEDTPADVPYSPEEKEILKSYEKKKYLPHHYQAAGFDGPIYYGGHNQRKRRKLARQTGRPL